MLEFRILGPLQALDHEPLVLGGHKQQAVLAVLLLHRGEPVAADRLIEAVWAGRPPATASKTLQVYVSNLRKALGEGPLITHGRGYALELGPDQVDSDRFEQLAARGREELEHGDPHRARTWLETALKLWRGPALADFSYESFAQSEIARLEEVRMAAVESRIEADLRLGRHAALVPELEALVHEHPLRERLYEQLMVALYRCGRQVDALERYQRARRKLVDDFGIEPGPRLQEIQRAVLNHDAALDLPGRRKIRQRAGSDARRAGAPARRQGSAILASLMSFWGLLSALGRRAAESAGRVRQLSRQLPEARAPVARRWQGLRGQVAGGTWVLAAAGALLILGVVLVLTVGGHSRAHAGNRMVVADLAGISSPASGGVYSQHQLVATSFSCAQTSSHSGLKACSDSTGTVTVRGGRGHLDTSSMGLHHYWVAATAKSGQTKTASITYTVVPPPSGSIQTAVAIVAHARTSVTVSCAGEAAGVGCRATLSLTVTGHVVRRAGQRRGAGAPNVRLAGTSFSLPADAKRSIAVPLTNAGILALRSARNHQLSVVATITVSGGKTTARTITLRRRRHP